MKTYTITVNGNVYNVTVEERRSTGTADSDQKSILSQIPEAATRRTAASSGGSGSVKITASVSGKICKIEAKMGQTVKIGDTIIILEAMRMEIPIVAPQDGTIANVNVAEGDAVECGDVLAMMD